MIAAIVRGGRSSSFKGALDYVLRHDPERVGEIGTANLFSTPGQAHTEMQTTVDAAKTIQARARAERGERSTASGSRAERTCFHYALSWHPDDDVTPDRMFAAAHQTLERLGLSQHQAVIAQHRDRPHPHVHVIVSTIHPETGRANGLFRKTYVLDRWCHEYEKGQEMFRAFKRAAKYERQATTQQPDWKAWKQRQKDLWQARVKDEAALKAKQEARRERHEERVNEVRRTAEIEKAHARSRHRREIAEFWRKQAPKMTVQLRPSPSFLRGMSTEGGEMGKALKGILTPRFHAPPPQQPPARAPVHSTFKRALSSTSPLQPPSPEQVRSGVNSQFRERSEPSKGNAIRHTGITDRFQGEQAIKRWQRAEVDEIDRRMRAAVEHLREQRDQEREEDEKEHHDLKGKHEHLREDARREMGIPEPKRPEREDPEPTPTKDVDESAPERDANELGDTGGHVDPEPARDDHPPLEPDSYIPADRAPPPPEPDMDFDMDFEMGD